MTWLAETAMLSHGWRRFALVVFAGVLAGLSIAPLFVLPALFIALPVWVWCLDGAEQRKGVFRRLFGPAFRIGFGFGTGYFTVSFHWLGTAFFADGGPILWLMPFAIVGLAMLIALFWGLASALAFAFWSNGPWRIVTLASALALFEWLRGHLFTGFPFDLLGYGLTATDEMAQLASVIGVYGLTLLAALLGMTPALIWPGDGRPLARRLAPFFLALLAIAGQVGFGAWRLSSTPVETRTDIRLRLVQPMVNEHTNWENARPADIISRLVDLSSAKTGPSDPGLDAITHLVWPESSLPFFLSQYPEAYARIARMLPPNTLLLTGAAREDYGKSEAAPGASTPAYNAVLAINTEGEVVASYDKSHLVPFGEYLPFPELFAAMGLRQFVPGADGWIAGDGRRLMAPPGSPAFLALICYEMIFSGDLGSEIKDAEFLFNITNDSWFDGSIGPAQHAQHARLRAVEEGLPLVRAANSGLTFLTDPLGRVTASLAPGQTGVLDVVPARRLEATWFSRLGYWPFWGAEFLGLLIALASARASRRAVAK